MNDLIVLGWDPGVSHLAYGVIKLGPTSSRVLDHKMIGHTDASASNGDRLNELAARIDSVMNRWCPDVVGAEDQSGVAAGNAREGSEAVNYSSHWVHDICGMLRFAARCSLETPVPFYTAAPSTIKVSVLGKGSRSAEKSEVKFAIRRLFGVQKCSNHESDAIAVAVAVLRKHRHAEVALRRSASVIS